VLSIAEEWPLVKLYSRPLHSLSFWPFHATLFLYLYQVHACLV
jgi:hypothetical protein